MALVLQSAALAALGLALSGVSWLDARRQPRLLVLVDRSQSVPRSDADQAIAGLRRAVDAAGGGEVQLLEFAGRPAPQPTPSDGAAGDLEPSTTNIEAALDAALAAHVRAPRSGLVVVSDGLENVGDATRALRAVRDARLPLQWIAVGRPPPRTRIAEVLAPERALAGQRVQLGVQLAGQLDRPLRVRASVRTSSGETQAASSEAGDAGRATVEFDASRSGAVLVDLALEDPATGRTLDAMPDAAVIDVAPRAAILYAQGSAGPLASSLLRGGWALDVVPAARLDTRADGLDGYQAVVLDDVAIADASPRFWSALVAAVKERGLGLMVLGGERSFARGGYRHSALESVLPVWSEPAALDQPASIVFVVDKSGSMGQGSGGVDRFALAQRAVQETARGLAERDSLGLVVFDVAPRVLIPLGPAPAGALALARPWPASPRGGTRLAAAIETAIGELERSGRGRRMLVVVTDGFIDNVPLAGLRARLDRSRIETIALAVGPDADVGALQRLVDAESGLVLRVDQAAELPLMMRSGLERRRARVERGTIEVEQPRALPFAPGPWQDWPPITAHFATRPRPDAVVAVQTRRGEPLIAYQRSGRGRVVALTCGLGRWTPHWLRWREWPRLAGGLADWISAARPGVAALAVSDLPAGLQVEADIDDASGVPDPGRVSIAVDTPTTQGRLLPAEYVAPGRLRATLPDAGPGLYDFLVSTPAGTQRHLHLRRGRAENDAWGVNPALDEWQATGLVGRRDPVALARHRGDPAGRGPVDRSLVGLGLALFLTGVVVDRTRLNATGIRTALRRWRARA